MGQIVKVLAAFVAMLSGAAHGDHRDDYDWADDPYEASVTVRVPLLLAPSYHDPLGGVLRIINHSSNDGHVRITGIDDDGQRFGSSDWYLNPKASLTIAAADLEDGEPLPPYHQGGAHHDGLGDGVGHWRLEIQSQLDLEVLTYTRSAGGGLASTAHDAVSEITPLRYHVPTFNGGTWRARLRLSNPGMDNAATAIITGLDDVGDEAPSGEVEITIPPGATCTVSSAQLETGDGITCESTGWLGNGAGKWQLFVAADRPIEVLNLLINQAGHVVNLSTTSRLGPPYTTAGELLKCTNERELARNFSRVAREWDGTPFRVDIADNFPDFVSREDLMSLLMAPVGRLADRIERQIGYRVIEIGEVIEVPEHIEPTSTNFTEEMSKLREHNHILTIYWSEWDNLTAFLGSGLIVYGERIVTLWEEPDYGSFYRNIAGIVHEVFHHLGFKHPPPFSGHDNPSGVPMVKGPLTKPGDVGSTAYYPSWSEIDALRCIFPLR